MGTPHKEVFKRYGTIPFFGTIPYLFLYEKIVILRTFLNFLIRWNINHTHYCKTNIHLHVAVTSEFIFLIDFNTLSQKTYQVGRKFLYIGQFSQHAEYQSQIYRLLLGLCQNFMALFNFLYQYFLFSFIACHHSSISFI